MPALLVAVFLVIAGYVTTARADIFRCPNGNLVSSGDSISEVIVKCDPPTALIKRIEPGETSRGRALYVEVEEWTYNQGPHTLVHYLEFRNGILVAVRTGTFGR